MNDPDAGPALDAEVQQILARILRRAAAVVADNDLVDAFGAPMAPVGVRELADALDELPFRARLRWGL